jgi:hypothetical protein
MGAASIDGPSRPFGVEFALGAGITVVLMAIIGVATMSSIGLAGLLFYVFAFVVGLVAWIPLLLVARRITRQRRAGVRVVASASAALLAIALNFAVVAAVAGSLGGYWGLYIAFAAVDSVVFLVAALVAAFVAHLGASVATRRSR